MTDRPASSPRPATPADTPAVRRALCRAFAEDELFVWYQPDPELRQRLLAALFGYLGHLLPGTEVTHDGPAVTGAAVWAAPGRWLPSRPRQILALPRLLAAAGRGNWRALSERAAVAERAFARAHPERPHWYLAALGIDPDVHGGGRGSALVHSGIARAARDGVPAYLECLADLVPFYERHGFRTVHRVGLPPGAPQEYGMVWEPA